MYDHLEDLETLGVAVYTRESGNSQRYELAVTDVTDRLYQLDGLVLRRLLAHEGKLEWENRDGSGIDPATVWRLISYVTYGGRPATPPNGCSRPAGG